jgi:hypothetical protein
MPKSGWSLALIWLSALAAPVAAAASERQKLAIADALGSVEAQGKLDQSVKLFWGSQPHPQAVREFGRFTAIRDASRFHRASPAACHWALLSALIFLQNLAKEHGGNAVTDIRSEWTGGELSSASAYGCAVGSFQTKVILHAEILRLP